VRENLFVQEINCTEGVARARLPLISHPRRRDRLFWIIGRSPGVPFPLERGKGKREDFYGTWWHPPLVSLWERVFERVYALHTWREEREI